MPQGEAIFLNTNISKHSICTLAHGLHICTSFLRGYAPAASHKMLFMESGSSGSGEKVCSKALKPSAPSPEGAGLLEPGLGRRHSNPLPLALGGIQEDVLHVVDLAAEVSAPHSLLFLELTEHQPLFLQCLNHACAVAIQPLLVEQELSCRRVKRAATEAIPSLEWGHLLYLLGQPKAGTTLARQAPLLCPNCPLQVDLKTNEYPLQGLILEAGCEPALSCWWSPPAAERAKLVMQRIPWRRGWLGVFEEH